jgi:hypothetical protein
MEDTVCRVFLGEENLSPLQVNLGDDGIQALKLVRL